MRYTILTLVALTVGMATPAFAEVESLTTSPQQIASALPNFNDCYRLAWVRGVHVEQNELPAWTEECMAGRIPFDSGFHADSVVPDQK
ncbi:MAG TPA: hypothetical protein VIJ78_01235 [Pseudolabrys sp.]|nr:hypothetical protein [Pseudolabrys sp.]